MRVFGRGTHPNIRLDGLQHLPMYIPMILLIFTLGYYVTPFGNQFQLLSLFLSPIFGRVD